MKKKVLMLLSLVVFTSMPIEIFADSISLEQTVTDVSGSESVDSPSSFNTEPSTSTTDNQVNSDNKGETPIITMEKPSESVSTGNTENLPTTGDYDFIDNAKNKISDFVYNIISKIVR
jgi:hypothetical protein